MHPARLIEIPVSGIRPFDVLANYFPDKSAPNGHLIDIGIIAKPLNYFSMTT
jgi:hypothetical protein